MDPLGAGQSEQTAGRQAIRYSERRSHRRFPIALKVRWRFTHDKGALDSGIGTTVDLSSGGLSFETDGALRPGTSIELSIAWPVLLHDAVPLQLMVVGDVVRSAGRLVAARIRHHEFRTVALEDRGASSIIARHAARKTRDAKSPRVSDLRQ